MKSTAHIPSYDGRDDCYSAEVEEWLANRSRWRSEVMPATAALTGKARVDALADWIATDHLENRSGEDPLRAARVHWPDISDREIEAATALAEVMIEQASADAPYSEH